MDLYIKILSSIVGIYFFCVGLAHCLTYSSNKEFLEELKSSATGQMFWFSVTGLLFWNFLRLIRIPEAQLKLIYHTSFLVFGLLGFSLSVFIWFI